MAADIAHGLDGGGDQAVVGDVEEPCRVGPGAGVDRPVGAEADRFEGLGAEPAQVQPVGQHAAHRRGKAANRWDHAERVPVCHHDAGVGVDREQRVEREQVGGGLEDPVIAP